MPRRGDAVALVIGFRCLWADAEEAFGSEGGVDEDRAAAGADGSPWREEVVRVFEDAEGPGDHSAGAGAFDDFEAINLPACGDEVADRVVIVCGHEADLDGIACISRTDLAGAADECGVTCGVADVCGLAGKLDGGALHDVAVVAVFRKCGEGDALEGAAVEAGLYDAAVEAFRRLAELEAVAV